MKIDKYMAKKLYRECFACCQDVCKTYIYNEDNEENKDDCLCVLCYNNNQQFFVPSDDFIKRINVILEEK